MTGSLDKVHEPYHLTEFQKVDPARCKPWKYHNRDAAWLTKERCLDLIVSIQKIGQIEPAIVRKIKDNSDYDFAIVCGVRRWFACLQIPNQKFLVCVTDADDKTCMILMHAENADSKDISEFERAFSFSQQMKSGAFKNQTELAEAMGVSQGTISKMIRAAEIFEHDWIKALFHDKLDIPVKHAYALSILLKNPDSYELIRKEAAALQAIIEETGQFPLASAVLRRLMAHAKPMPPRTMAESTVLVRDNKPVVSCRRDKFGKFYLMIEKNARALNHGEIESACMKAIREHVFE